MRFNNPNVATPKSLVILINVGKNSDGSVFMGADNKRGNHFTVCFVNTETKEIIYGGSCGWGFLVGLLDKINRLYTAIYKQPLAGYAIRSCHDYNYEKGGVHYCNKSKCSTYFPLQTCSYICGFVAITVASIACLSKNFFDCITRVHQIMENTFPTSTCKHQLHMSDTSAGS